MSCASRSAPRLCGWVGVVSVSGRFRFCGSKVVGKEGKGEGKMGEEGRDAHGPGLELRADELGHGEEGHALDLHDGGRVEVARAGLAGGEDLDLRAGGLWLWLWLWERECELNERRRREGGKGRTSTAGITRR